MGLVLSARVVQFPLSTGHKIAGHGLINGLKYDTDHDGPMLASIITCFKRQIVAVTAHDTQIQEAFYQFGINFGEEIMAK